MFYCLLEWVIFLPGPMDWKMLLLKLCAHVCFLRSMTLGGHSCVTSSEGGTSGAAETVDKSKLMSLMAQLRKASNHPYLFPGIEKVPRAVRFHISAVLMVLEIARAFIQGSVLLPHPTRPFFTMYDVLLAFC
jgi:hypothetical protein